MSSIQVTNKEHQTYNSKTRYFELIFKKKKLLNERKGKKVVDSLDVIEQEELDKTAYLLVHG